MAVTWRRVTLWFLYRICFKISEYIIYKNKVLPYAMSPPCQRHVRSCQVMSRSCQVISRKSGILKRRHFSARLKNKVLPYAMSEEGSKRRAFRRKTQNAARLKKQSVTLRHVRRRLKTTGFSTQNAEFGTAKKTKCYPTPCQKRARNAGLFRAKRRIE